MHDFCDRKDIFQTKYFKLFFKSHGDILKMFELIKIGNQRINDLVDLKSEAEIILGGFYSVQFFLNDKGLSYLFKLRNFSSNRPYILVKQDSSVFKELNVGDIFDMQYNQNESLGASKRFKTQIISKNSHDRYPGHSMVELSIINNPDGEKIKPNGPHGSKKEQN